MKLLRVLAVFAAVALLAYGCASHEQKMSTSKDTGDAAKAGQQTGSLKTLLGLPGLVLPDLFIPNSQDDADWAGWSMFMNFNWPSFPEGSSRGKRDGSLPFGYPGRPVVWETWKTPDEVFYPDGSQPPGWNTYGTRYPSQCNYDPVNKPGLLVDRTAQASGGPLTDANGNIVYYLISFNKQVFDFIYNNGYYNITGQKQMKLPVSYPAGAAEMKAAWRVLMPSEPEAVKKRFFRRNMYVYTPGKLTKTGQPICEYKEMALLGLHFNLKVNYPDKQGTQWLMATFEQVDNVPPFKTPFEPGVDAGRTLPYSLFNSSCYGATPPCKYNWSTEAVPNPRPWQTPTEAIRTMNIDLAAQLINPVMQAMLRDGSPDNPWQYYEMVTTQYPKDPSQNPVGNPTPPTSANTSMETFVRTSSCLGCHHDAKDANNKWFADYSFMLRQACPPPLFGPFKPTPACPQQKK